MNEAYFEFSTLTKKNAKSTKQEISFDYKYEMKVKLFE